MNIVHNFTKAVSEGNVGLVRQLLSENQSLRDDKDRLNRCIKYAEDNVPVIEALVEAGADINAGSSATSPEGAIVEAVRNGYFNAVRWMLAHGATLNHEVDGKRRCFALSGAAMHGNLEMVKLLVEAGADFNAIWAKFNALTFAVMYGQKEVEKYLRSVGAKEPWEILGEKPPAQVAAEGRPADLLEHIRKYLGEPSPASIQRIVPAGPPFQIHVVRTDEATIVLTRGVSDHAMAVPDGGTEFKHVELMLVLPVDWPITPDLSNPARAWPFLLLRKLAIYAFQPGQWFGPASVIDMDEPIIPGTRMSFAWVVGQDDEFGRVTLKDGREIVIYSVFPLYREERDVCMRDGIPALLDLFQRKEVSKIIDPKRWNSV